MKTNHEQLAITITTKRGRDKNARFGENCVVRLTKVVSLTKAQTG